MAIDDEYVYGIYTDESDKLFKLNLGKNKDTRTTFESIRPSGSQTDEFKSVISLTHGDLNNWLDKLFSNEIDEVNDAVRSIFTRISQIYGKLPESQVLGHSEAAYHGFSYGGLVLNFKYRYGLNRYVERVAGSGRADLVIISRKNIRIHLQPIPVVIEFKSGDHSVSEAIQQIKDKGIYIIWQ